MGLKNIISEMRKRFKLEFVEIIDVPEDLASRFGKDLYIDDNMFAKGIIKSFSRSELKARLESDLDENEFREEILKPKKCFDVRP